MFGETTISYVKIWNHPIETTTYKWMFQVPGLYFFLTCQNTFSWSLKLEIFFGIHGSLLVSYGILAVFTVNPDESQAHSARQGE